MRDTDRLELCGRPPGARARALLFILKEKKKKKEKTLSSENGICSGPFSGRGKVAHAVIISTPS